MTKKTSLFLFGYITLIGLIMFQGYLGPDTYYYLEWSRHLALSYFDGAPMIAYALHIVTSLFGTSTIAILSLGFIAILLTSYFCYQCAMILFDDDHTANICVCVWLTALVSLRHFFLLITYDTTVIIFWSLTCWLFLKLIQTKKIRYYYCCGVSIGLMLLSKYTGILLCISFLIICSFYPRYRFVFKNKHFYSMLLIAILVFSPVLIWNMQHDWISFSYQLTKGLVGNFHPLSGVILYLKQTIINFNIYFLILISIFFYYGKQLFKHPLTLITIPTFFVWLFFFFVSIKTVPLNGDSWNSESFFTGALLIGFFLSKKSQKIRITLITIAFIPSIIYLLMCRFPEWNPLPGWSKVYAAKKLLSNIPETSYAGKVIYHNGQYWLSSFISYFLSDHPRVYSTDFQGGNQFALWNAEVKPAKSGQSIILFSTQNKIADPHYTQCKLISKNTFLQKNIFKANQYWYLYQFQCTFIR